MNEMFQVICGFIQIVNLEIFVWWRLAVCQCMCIQGQINPRKIKSDKCYSEIENYPRSEC
jgi:hypothetical protein